MHNTTQTPPHKKTCVLSIAPMLDTVPAMCSMGALQQFFLFSKRCHFSCIGDIMGRALKNIEKLLKMPFGCGEQNMARLAPNIYILEYLKNTGQLTEAIEKKSNKFLTSGGCLFYDVKKHRGLEKINFFV